MKTLINLLKENKGIVFWSILLLSLWMYHKDSFFIIALVYIYIIKFLLSNTLKEKARKYISISIYIFACFVFLSVYYVNNFMPHGTSYSTGDIVCQNDDRGPCREEYKEDMRDLDIPDWAKFLRSRGILLIFGLVGAGICAGSKKSDE